MEVFMEEIYKIIEDKIEASGYTGYIDGEEIYDEISDEVNAQWLWGSSMSGRASNNGNYIRENKFSFTKTFDWDNVEKLIINGTEIGL